MNKPDKINAPEYGEYCWTAKIRFLHNHDSLLENIWKKIFMLLLCVNVMNHASSQVLTLKDAQTKAEQNSAAIQAALLGVDESKSMEKTAFNLSQPQLQIQAPTGNFYAIGVQQNFEFPTVYGARKKLLQSQSAVVEAKMSLTKAEVKFLITDLYLKWQVTEAKLNFYKNQSNNFSSLADAAERSFQAGEIDLLEKSFAVLKAQDAQREVQLLIGQSEAAKKALLTYVASDENIQCDSLSKNLELRNWNTIVSSSPMLEVARAEVMMSEQQLKLQKKQNLPGFFVGYMNQGERNSPAENRFNAGLSIPIWFWQSNASIKAAKLNLEQSQKELEAIQQQWNQMYNSLLINHDSAVQSILDIQTTSIPASIALISNAKRMYDAGEITLVEYLRLISEANRTELAQIALIEQLLQYQNQLQFLTSAP